MSEYVLKNEIRVTSKWFFMRIKKTGRRKLEVLFTTHEKDIPLPGIVKMLRDGYIKVIEICTSNTRFRGEYKFNKKFASISFHFPPHQLFEDNIRMLSKGGRKIAARYYTGGEPLEGKTTIYKLTKKILKNEKVIIEIENPENMQLEILNK